MSVVGYAVGAAPTMSSKRRLASFLDVLTDDETDYFHRSFDALDVPESERTHPGLAPITERLGELFLCAALDGGYAETLVVLVLAE